MNIHRFLDRASIQAGALYGEQMRFFREGTKSRSLAQITEDIQLEFPDPVSVGTWSIPVRYGSIEGFGALRLISCENPNDPLLLFHHGSGEHDYARRIMKVLPKRYRRGFSLAAISIPFNKNLKEYLRGIGSLERFAFMIAASVRIAEQMREHCSSLGCSRVILSGISLGGWVTNLHAALYGSMDEYRPICAGAALDALFTDSVYARMLSRSPLVHTDEISRVLNFEQLFIDQAPDTVYPLLGRFDQFIRYERQKGIYREDHLHTLEKGHITTALDTSALREYLLAALRT